MAARSPDREAGGPRAVRLAVRLTPRGGRDRVEGWAADAAGRAHLKVRVAAPAAEGRANAALIATALARPAGAVRIVAGQTARLKQLEIDGASQADIVRALGTPP